LRGEYNVEVVIEPATFTSARWLSDPDAKFTLGGQGAVATDRLERKVILFSSPWELEYFGRQHPDVALLAESPQLVS
jgi:peptide subunit release factor RF-3